MHNRRLSLATAILFTAVTLVVTNAPATPAQRLDPRFGVGDVFPDLALPSLEDGTLTRLSDFRGGKVMLHVFASW